MYDRAGILTPGEIADLETHAAAVERAGAPTVVYLQARDASQDETIQDGRDLMQAWNVESSSGARDGVVIFLNLQPDDLRHGEAAIIAGQKWNDKGVLTDRENQRIYDDVMQPLLQRREDGGRHRGGTRRRRPRPDVWSTAAKRLASASPASWRAGH